MYFQVFCRSSASLNHSLTSSIPRLVKSLNVVLRHSFPSLQYDPSKLRKLTSRSIVIYSVFIRLDAILHQIPNMMTILPRRKMTGKLQAKRTYISSPLSTVAGPSPKRPLSIATSRRHMMFATMVWKAVKSVSSGQSCISLGKQSLHSRPKPRTTPSVVAHIRS